MSDNDNTLDDGRTYRVPDHAAVWIEINGMTLWITAADGGGVRVNAFPGIGMDDGLGEAFDTKTFRHDDKQH